MEAKITKQGNFERVMEVDVPENELSPHFDNALRKYQKNLKLEGFRKGKVPLSVVKKLYGDVIKSDALDEVVQSVFIEVKNKENLRPVAPAKLQDIDYNPENGLHFKATVEVVPEIDIKNYTGLSVEREVYQVDEQDIEGALSDVRERMAVMDPVEGSAEQDHYLLVDFQEVDSSGLPLVGKKYEDRLVVLNAQNPELMEQLIGASAGDKQVVILPSYDEKGNKQADERYEVNIKEIKSKVLPALDDELARDVGDFETLDALKTDIRNNLLKQTELSSRRTMRRKLADELLKKNSFDLPESMVNNYLDAIVDGAKKDGSEEVDEAQLREDYRPSAIWNLKWELVKDKLKDIESISLSEEDKNEFIARISEERNVSEKEIRKSLKNKTTLRRFEEDVLEEKILDYLEGKAKIKEKKITRKDIEKARRVSA